jgi:acyl CoA:acetate/3-ketoacid CoA transferase alpha subunit
VSTVVEEGKERRYFEGKPCLLEHALKLDYALLRAYKADKLGNLIYRGTQRNFNPVMATAAEVSIVEVDEIVEIGELNPEAIVTREFLSIV